MSSDVADGRPFHKERTVRRTVRSPNAGSDRPALTGDARLNRLEDTVGSNFRWVLGVFGAGFMILLSAYAAGFVILTNRIDGLQNRSDARFESLSNKIDARTDAMNAKLDALTRDFDTRMTRLEARGMSPSR